MARTLALLALAHTATAVRIAMVGQGGRVQADPAGEAALAQLAQERQPVAIAASFEMHPSGHTMIAAAAALGSEKSPLGKAEPGLHLLRAAVTGKDSAPLWVLIEVSPPPSGEAHESYYHAMKLVASHLLVHAKDQEERAVWLRVAFLDSVSDAREFVPALPCDSGAQGQLTMGPLRTYVAHCAAAARAPSGWEPIAAPCNGPQGAQGAVSALRARLQQTPARISGAGAASELRRALVPGELHMPLPADDVEQQTQKLRREQLRCWELWRSYYDEDARAATDRCELEQASRSLEAGLTKCWAHVSANTYGGLSAELMRAQGELRKKMTEYMEAQKQMPQYQAKAQRDCESADWLTRLKAGECPTLPADAPDFVVQIAKQLPDWVSGCHTAAGAAIAVVIFAALVACRLLRGQPPAPPAPAPLRPPSVVPGGGGAAANAATGGSGGDGGGGAGAAAGSGGQ